MKHDIIRVSTGNINKLTTSRQNTEIIAWDSQHGSLLRIVVHEKKVFLQIEFNFTQPN